MKFVDFFDTCQFFGLLRLFFGAEKSVKEFFPDFFDAQGQQIVEALVVRVTCLFQVELVKDLFQNLPDVRFKNFICFYSEDVVEDTLKQDAIFLECDALVADGLINVQEVVLNLVDQGIRFMAFKNSRSVS